jgi:hypothetical protein
MRMGSTGMSRGPPSTRRVPVYAGHTPRNAARIEETELACREMGGSLKRRDLGVAAAASIHTKTIFRTMRYEAGYCSATRVGPGAMGWHICLHLGKRMMEGLYRQRRRARRRCLHAIIEM